MKPSPSRDAEPRASASGMNTGILLDHIRRAQNPDGGWGYQPGGSSWTEPTAYALLALRAEQDPGVRVQQGAAWLRATRRADGGWAPQPAVDQSTWVTALALLCLSATADLKPGDPGVKWLLERRGADSSLIFRLRSWLLGNRPEHPQHEAWSWFPGTASWVGPTAFAVLALREAKEISSQPELQERLDEGRQFLLSRICRDGGWNHGSSRALGYEADSYPEMTGLALLAMQGVQDSRLPRAIDCARSHLRACRSIQGICWLKLALLAHGQPALGPEPVMHHRLDVIEAALWILTAAAEKGRNIFVEAA